ncbi:hypothetical protein [Virgibacillus salinus]|uniref:Uncharacterized protein n=1 Tax=Virgibacillus salinus TaxID=553311 RepID=A0A1H1GH74_9BACI|nr:hypothetical protein [Virgibacillus salinus]SDR12527.1 hypothetical protein SAMN05216231_3723 [Virgibacillus salinus]
MNYSVKLYLTNGKEIGFKLETELETIRKVKQHILNQAEGEWYKYPYGAGEGYFRKDHVINIIISETKSPRVRGV